MGSREIAQEYDSADLHKGNAFYFFLFKDGTCGQSVTPVGQPSVAPMGHNIVVGKLTLKMPIRSEHKHANFRNSVFALAILQARLPW